MRLIRALVVGLALASCSSSLDEQTGSRDLSIINGQREMAEPWTVAVTYQRPGTTKLRLCTGSVIAPRVVMTAKHCVFDDNGQTEWATLPASAFTVSVGHSITAAGGVQQEIGVAEVRTTPGNYTRDDALAGDDIALLMLTSDLGVVPKPVSRTSAAAGDPIKILGFGFTETDELGSKYQATAMVSQVGPGTFETTGAAWTCTGDSGGPALHLGRGELVGITSFGPSNCDVSNSFYTRVDRHLTLIDAALGTECMPVPEVCDGLDNDCDGQIDNGCPAGNGGVGGAPGAGGASAGGAGGSAIAGNGGASAAPGSTDSGGCSVAAPATSPSSRLVAWFASWR